ncbi:MAG: segregation and condensation protein A [Chitinophagales bacterium]
MSYTVNLEAFQGPMDVLLQLIDQNQIDIYDIPIANITGQYLDYIAEMPEVDLDILADFLVMAATLIRIKSKMLVPRYKTEDDEPEEEMEEDPRQELVKRLVEYRRLKQAAEMLTDMQQGSVPRVYYREDQVEEQEIELRASLPQLLKAFREILDKKADELPGYVIPEDDIDIAEKMEVIINKLRERKRGLILQALFSEIISKREAIGLFMALLELIKLGRVKAWQESLFGPIKVRLIRGENFAG